MPRRKCLEVKFEPSWVAKPTLTAALLAESSEASSLDSAIARTSDRWPPASSTFERVAASSATSQTYTYGEGTSGCGLLCAGSNKLTVDAFWIRLCKYAVQGARPGGSAETAFGSRTRSAVVCFLSRRPAHAVGAKAHERRTGRMSKQNAPRCCCWPGTA